MFLNDDLLPQAKRTRVRKPKTPSTPKSGKKTPGAEGENAASPTAADDNDEVRRFSSFNFLTKSTCLLTFKSTCIEIFGLALDSRFSSK